MGSSGNGSLRKNGASRHTLLEVISHQWQFMNGFVRRPNVVGGLTPSSRALAAALCEPIRNARRPIAVLEVGAGTGPVTRHLGTILNADDQLDVCEIVSDFADIIERDVLTQPQFAPLVSHGRVRLLRMPVQRLNAVAQYDFIISGLPLTAFELRDVEDVFSVFRRCLKRGGVFSYFEYLGFRRTTRALALGKARDRIRAVNRYLNQNLRRHRFASRKVLRNIPPACAHHLRFDA